METITKLKYSVVKNKTQYNNYCDALEELTDKGKHATAEEKKEIELLSLLIEKWDDEHNTFDDLNPVELLRSFMDDHGLKDKDLITILNVSKGYISEMLNYKKGMSLPVIKALAKHFKVREEAFSRAYPLKNTSALPKRI